MKRSSAKFSLKYKFTIYLCLLMIIIMSIIYFSTVAREKEKMVRISTESGKTLTKILAKALLPLQLENNYREMQITINEIKNNPLINKISLINENRLCIVSNDKNEENKTIDSSILTKVISKNEPYNYINKDLKFIEFYHPLKWADKNYGVVVLKYSLNTMHEEIAKAVKQISFILLIALIGSFFVSFLLSRIITEPIADLVQSARLIASGDFSHTIPVKGNDELTDLAKDFNRMTFNISILYNVLKKMNFNTDPDVLLNIIIDNAKIALKAKKASLMLLDEKTNEMKLKVVRGVDGKIKNNITIKPGIGIAGKVFETGEAYISNRVSDDPLFKKFNENTETKVKNILCVPLKSGKNIFGVINVTNKEDNDFNEYDLKLLTALTSQAAMTINKAKLYHESITDGMTGLFIHRHFQTRLQDEFTRAKRYNTPLGLIMFDIDHFKTFNDTYGHQQGDIVIKEVAEIVKNNCRKNIDIPARYGGEEFTIISIENTLDQIYTISERLRKAIEEYEFPGQEDALHVTISLGIVSIDNKISNKDMFIKMADTALYRAKESGRNQVCSWDWNKDKLE